jgi:hypothetical protein
VSSNVGDERVEMVALNQRKQVSDRVKRSSSPGMADPSPFLNSVADCSGGRALGLRLPCRASALHYPERLACCGVFVRRGLRNRSAFCLARVHDGAQPEFTARRSESISGPADPWRPSASGRLCGRRGPLHLDIGHWFDFRRAWSAPE